MKCGTLPVNKPTTLGHLAQTLKYRRTYEDTARENYPKWYRHFVWASEELESLIKTHDGYLATKPVEDGYTSTVLEDGKWDQYTWVCILSWQVWDCLVSYQYQMAEETDNKADRKILAGLCLSLSRIKQELETAKWKGD